MNLFYKNSALYLTEKIIQYEALLKQEKLVILRSYDHQIHIAAYIAWINNGGNIFVVNPDLPQEQYQYLMNELPKLTLTDSVLFHTSGTTGYPKIVINTKKQFDQFLLMVTHALNWDNDTKFINFIPASTSGFWHIVLPAFYKNLGSKLSLGNKETLVEDLRGNHNLTILIPSVIDMLRIKNANINFSHYNSICSGASAPQLRHAKFVFDHGGNKFNCLYGATEIGSPILSKLSYHLDDNPTSLYFTSQCDSEIKLDNNELLVRGPSVGESITDWFRTGDLFEQNGNLIKFTGRTNDIVKINGNTASLLLIETVLEDRLNLGEVLASIKHRSGFDFVEVQYTNKHVHIDKLTFRKQLESILTSYSIPVKYNLVESISKNVLGKKIRYANDKTNL